MHRGKALALGVVCCVLLSACQSDDAEPGAGGSTEPTEMSVSTPTATKQPPQSPTPPEMPALASQKSTAGAKAFVAYYIDVLNYSHQAESSRLLEPLAARGCLVCAAFAQSISQMKTNGGEQSGGDWRVMSVRPLSTSDRNSRNLTVHLLIEAGTAQRSSDDPVERIQRRKVYDDFFLIWRTDTWELEDLRPA